MFADRVNDLTSERHHPRHRREQCAGRRWRAPTLNFVAGFIVQVMGACCSGSRTRISVTNGQNVHSQLVIQPDCDFKIKR